MRATRPRDVATAFCESCMAPAGRREQSGRMTSSEFDVVVVGARVAGASTAMLLANAGYRVLLVDRAALPSEIARGHFVYRDAPRRLRHWGLLDRVLACGSPPVTTLTLDMGESPLVA